MSPVLGLSLQMLGHHEFKALLLLQQILTKHLPDIPEFDLMAVRPIAFQSIESQRPILGVWYPDYDNPNPAAECGPHEEGAVPNVSYVHPEKTGVRLHQYWKFCQTLRNPKSPEGTNISVNVRNHRRDLPSTPDIFQFPVHRLRPRGRWHFNQYAPISLNCQLRQKL